MEDYATYLSEQAQSDVAALHEFKILYDPRSAAFHFFFEGEEDSLFYMPEARRMLNYSIANVYYCGGKKAVIEIRDAIKLDGYDLGSCLFFVDRDYDDYLGSQVEIDEHTYITDSYSIENDVSTIGSAEILIADVIRLSRADAEFARIIADYSQASTTFYRKVRPLAAWILAAKESGRRPNLQNANSLKRIFEFDASGNPHLPKAGFTRFRGLVLGNKASPPLALTIKWGRRLRNDSPKLWVRGKYDLWFFQCMLIALLEDSSARKKAAGGRAIRISAALRDGRLFEILGGRVPPPVSLRNFFHRKLN